MSDPRQIAPFETDPTTNLGPGAVILGGFALAELHDLLSGVRAVAAAAPFRHLITPGGQPMSAAITNCGPLGWVSDRHGYRYQAIDPDGGAPWPFMPPGFARLASRAAQAAGYADFTPDACLVNRYGPGARMGLHQDLDERDLGAPIVSVSLGLPATFLWGGTARGGRVKRVPLLSGDVVVWGGPTRLIFHGIDPIKGGEHPMTGPLRYNLTFRRAG